LTSTNRGGSAVVWPQPDCFDVIPYFASLLKCCCIPEKWVHSRLLDAHLPFFLCAFRFKLSLTLFLFEFYFSLDSPFLGNEAERTCCPHESDTGDTVSMVNGGHKRSLRATDQKLIICLKAA